MWRWRHHTFCSLANGNSGTSNSSFNSFWNPINHQSESFSGSEGGSCCSAPVRVDDHKEQPSNGEPGFGCAVPGFQSYPPGGFFAPGNPAEVQSELAPMSHVGQTGAGETGQTGPYVPGRVLTGVKPAKARTWQKPLPPGAVPPASPSPNHQAEPDNKGKEESNQGKQPEPPGRLAT